MPRTNPDEDYVLRTAQTLRCIDARRATQLEDCGYRKADVVLTYLGKTYYVQVSRTPKSNEAHRRLARRGTIPLATHDGGGRRHDPDMLAEMILRILRDC